VDKSGRVQLAGSLADGTRFSHSGMLTGDGQWALYLPLYAGRGSVLSWLTLSNTPDGVLSGPLVWIKPQPANVQHASGFALQTTASGSRYIRPAAGERVLDFIDGQLVLKGGGLQEALTNRVALGTDNRVVNLGSDRLGLTFNLETGLFRGSVAHPAASKPISFSGVVLQRENLGAGCFRERGQSGLVLLEPLRAPGL
jgi:hypothetical protein